jgi:glycosyltransferase involved in cell wall biosynthesis
MIETVYINNCRECFINGTLTKIIDETIIDSPKVSVTMITYNHENFIARAIEGVMSQITNFDIELIIGEDCSTDSTRILVSEFQKKYPSRIVLKLPVNNLGITVNSVSNYSFCRGEYIASCEGDDYWTDPYKLQKQIDFLDKNLDFSMTFHTVEVKNEIKEVDYYYPIPKRNILFFKDLLFNHYIATCSLVFRKNFMPMPLPLWFTSIKSGDIAIQLILSDKGKVKFFEEKMAVYRLHRNGITQNVDHLSNARWNTIFLYNELRKYFRGKYNLYLIYLILKTLLGYIKHILKKSNI